MFCGPTQKIILVEAVLTDWRSKATRPLLAASALAYLPVLALLLAGQRPPLAGPVLLCMTIAYVVLVVSVLHPRIDYRVRAWIAMVAALLVAVIGIIANPSGPVPRGMAIVIPLMAMVLLGSRAGRVVTGVSAAALLFGPCLHDVPSLVGILTLPPRGTPVPPGVLWMQSVGLTAALITPVILLDRFQQFLMQTLADREREAAERSAEHRRLEREMLERRRLEREVARVSDEERRRLGSDLHDGVCQQITGALLRCVSLVRKLEKGECLRVEELTALSCLLEEAIDEAHAVAQGLCPLEPEPGALAESLQTLTKRMEAITGLPCRFIASGDVNVPESTAAQHLYRVAQEALSNATRHARASRLAVGLHGEEDRLVLEVEDNGDGLPEPIPRTGMGLRSMVFRAHLLKGELTVTPAPAGGTRVVCQVPRSALVQPDESSRDPQEDRHEQ